MQTIETSGPALLDHKPSPPRHRRRSIAITLAITTIGVLLIAAGLAIASSGSSNLAAGTVLAIGDEATTLADASEAAETVETVAAVGADIDIGDSAETLVDASDVGEAVIPSVVTIQVSDTFRNAAMVVGSGSGVIYDTSGHIVTNAHVVAAGESYEAVLWDGRVYSAEVVGIDATTDLAALQIAATDLAPITIGSTTDLHAGEPAIAVGSPLGLDGGPSLTVGVVSALDRLVEIDAETTLYGMIQADAPITQGSSGGALVDDGGRLIGITSAVGVSAVGVEGIGFSTPVEIVTRVVDELIAAGEATRPYLGISGTTGFVATADGGEEPIGVQIEAIEADSAAADAGLAVGDVITAIDGETVVTMPGLIAAMRTHSGGHTVDLTLTGTETTVRVTLGDA